MVTPALHPEHSPDSSVHAAEHSHVQTIRMEVSERTLSVIAIVFGSVSIVLTILLAWAVGMLVREAKQVQVQLMYANSIMLREGMVKPGDMVYGPEGNLEYRQHELKKESK